jgi:4-carboxymuconolactone decarboxylase
VENAASVREPRIPPRPPADWDAEVFDAFTVLGVRHRDPKAAGTEATERSASRPVSNILATFAQYPALAKAYLTFNDHLLFHSSLPDRTRELLILRIGWLRHAEYEWAQHVVIGKAAGLSEAEIEAVCEGAGAATWAPSDAALLRAVDELYADACVTDATWDLLSDQLDRHQLMDLVFTVGAYEVLAMAFNTFGLAMDPGLRGFEQLPGHLARLGDAGETSG